MILELLRAMLFAGLPVAAATFGLVYLALIKGYLGKTSSDSKALQAEMKKMSRKDRKTKGKSKQKAKSKLDYLHQNWLSFGGGFYGVVALVTYALVELLEIIDFINNFESFAHFIDTIGFGLLIKFFINSLLNFITAITWPAYWLSSIDSNYIYVWFIVAYLGYLVGIRFAHWFRFQAVIDEAELDD